MRTCIGCGRVAEQAELTRYALADGCVVPDPERRRPGRGAYVCSEACLREAAGRRAFARAFKARMAVEPDHLEWAG
jgi:uncharacterized protein